MEKLIQKWKEILFVAAVAGIVWNFYQIRTDASEAQKKVVQFEQTFENIAQIAKSLQDPNTWLYQYLVLHSIDSADARLWSNIPRGALTDTAGKPLGNIPFLDDSVLPELGVHLIYNKECRLIVLDTLWDFRQKERAE